LQGYYNLGSPEPYKILAGELEDINSRPRRRWEDNIKMYLKIARM
jgi:hypothetical protein